MTKFSNFLELPEDVIIEILSRLPVKSLIRFKAVCKYWCIIIQSRSFAAKHLQHQKNKEDLFLHTYHSHGGESVLSLFPDKYLAGTSQEYHDHIPAPTSFSAVLGPVDGVVFLYNVDENQLVLWNPATREVKHLPSIVPSSSFPLMPSPSDSFYSYVFGFGKDPLTDELKVVWVRDYWDDDKQIWHVPLVSVYNLTTDSWRQFKDHTFSSLRVLKSYANTYLNGFYYWRAISNCQIFAFDLRNEVFEEIKTPDTFKSMQGNLGLYNDSLGIFVCNRNSNNISVDIWVMQQEEQRWTKKVSIGSLLNIRRALGCWKTGNIFIETGTLQMGLLNPKVNEIRNLGARINYCLQVSCYEESLRPLN